MLHFCADWLQQSSRLIDLEICSPSETDCVGSENTNNGPDPTLSSISSQHRHLQRKQNYWPLRLSEK